MWLQYSFSANEYCLSWTQNLSCPGPNILLQHSQLSAVIVQGLQSPSTVLFPISTHTERISRCYAPWSVSRIAAIEESGWSICVYHCSLWINHTNPTMQLHFQPDGHIAFAILFIIVCTGWPLIAPIMKITLEQGFSEIGIFLSDIQATKKCSCCHIVS